MYMVVEIGDVVEDEYYSIASLKEALRFAARKHNISYMGILITPM